MFIYTLYTLTGETLGQTPLLEQAMRTARAYAAARRVSCVVECRRLDTDEARRVLLNSVCLCTNKTKGKNHYDKRNSFTRN